MAFEEADVIAALSNAAQLTSTRLQGELKFSEPGDPAR
jgi:hypothetical protein